MWELVRRLLLTSILAFVEPRTASQVTVGVIITFVTLILLGVFSPYAYSRPGFVAYASYIELFLVLFVGLLLKVLGPRVPRSRGWLRQRAGAAAGARGHGG